MSWNSDDEYSVLGTFYDNIREIRAEMATAKCHVEKAFKTFDRNRAEDSLQEIYSAVDMTSRKLAGAWNSFVYELEDLQLPTAEGKQGMRLIEQLGAVKDVDTLTMTPLKKHTAEEISASLEKKRLEEEANMQNKKPNPAPQSDLEPEVQPSEVEDLTEQGEEEPEIIGKSSKRGPGKTSKNKTQTTKPARITKSTARKTTAKSAQTRKARTSR